MLENQSFTGHSKVNVGNVKRYGKIHIIRSCALILVCDVDSTLLEPPSSRGLESFRRRAKSETREIPGARKGLSSLLGQAPNLVIILTARHKSLEIPTKQALYFRWPELRSMRVVWSFSSSSADSVADKLSRLERLRMREPGPIVLVDDDVRMRAGVREQDTFLHAPNCWAGYIPHV